MKSRILLSAFVLVFFLFGSTAFSLEKEPLREIREKVGDMEFRLHHQNGVNLDVFGVPMLHHSYLVAISPGWSDYFYTSTRDLDLSNDVRVESFKGGKKITIIHEKPSDLPPFKGCEIITLLPDNTYSVAIEFTFSGRQKALYEWRIGGVNAFPLMGRSFTASDDGVTTKGVLPIQAEYEDFSKSMVSRGFKNISIDSLLGKIEITASPVSNVVFFDYRKSPWAVSNEPCFWLGILENPLKKNKKYSHSVSLRFPQKLEQGKSISVSVSLPVSPMEKVQVPFSDSPFIIPAPKQYESLDLLFPLSSSTKIHIGKDPTPGLENALSFFLEDLKDLYSVEPRVLREEFPGGKTPMNLVIIGKMPQYQDLCNICDNFNLRIPDKKQGYSLFVHDDFACIGSHSDQGIFYGFTTLVQLIKFMEKGAFLKGAEIVDWPSVDFRGVHFLSGKDAGDQISKAVRNLLARFKMNTLVWECEYIIWDSHPEIAHPQFGMTKDDARKVIRAADANFVEIIPLIQSLGHSEWIFANRRNLELAEDPDAPYAYCPTNPETYKFIFSVYQEALDFFKPRAFHIGHDEVTNEGRFPYRSKSSGKTVTDLIMEDALKLHSWFSRKNVRVMLWGDMFLYATEGSGACLAPSLEDARLRRALLPKDVLIADWHYDAVEPAKYKSLKLFKDEGFEAVGAPWYNPYNIRNLARACIQYKAKGLLQTTWAGFNFKIDDNEESWFQYWAYILAAHYAWSGADTPVDELPFRAQSVFRDLWMERKPVKEKQDGFMLDLRDARNINLEDNENRTGWLGYGPDFDLSSFPLGKILLNDTFFLVQKNAKGEAAVSLSGKFHTGISYPETMELKVPEIEAREISFLLTASFRTRVSTRAGDIIIRYQDSSSEKIDLVYGKTIFTFTDANIGEKARIAWEGKSRKGDSLYIHELEWLNPYPEKKISSITLKSSGSEAAPILLAVTGKK
ncbi:family 20 glycosylhydrolase [Candidatus Sumerlaeota bacterium]|nr:family 20 glycosylhydrolase [Candidatus Sumerlaeota bacterium]